MVFFCVYIILFRFGIQIYNTYVYIPNNIKNKYFKINLHVKYIITIIVLTKTKRK